MVEWVEADGDGSDVGVFRDEGEVLQREQRHL